MRTTLLSLCALALLACAPDADPAEAPAIERSPDEAEPAPVAPSIEATGAPVAALHEQGLRDADRARGAQMLEQACDRGFAPSCLAFAERLEAGDGIEPDAERARGLFEEGCESGSTLACDRLGH